MGSTKSVYSGPVRDRRGDGKQTNMWAMNGTEHEAAACVVAHLLRGQVDHGHHLTANQILCSVVLFELCGGLQFPQRAEVKVQNEGWASSGLEVLYTQNLSNPEVTRSKMREINGVSQGWRRTFHMSKLGPYPR